VRVADDAGTGVAQATISFDAWQDGAVRPTHHEIEVVAPQVAVELQPVSPRLKRRLMHPNRGSILQGVQYSPDGRRIIAGDYPGGVVQTWDAESGRQLTTIETGDGYRGSAEYFFVSPDWKMVYVARKHVEATKIEKGGRALFRWTCDGDVRAWDLDSGELQATFEHTPPRAIYAMTLSPDGASFLTGEWASGEWEQRAPFAAAVWNVATGRSAALGDGLFAHGVFSPDSSRVAVTAVDDDVYTTAVKLFDVASGEAVRSIPVGVPRATVTLLTFDAEGRTLVGRVQALPDKGDGSEPRSWLTFWDVHGGEEVGSIPAEEPNEIFSWPAAVSGDGRLLATGSLRASQAVVCLVDLEHRKLLRRIVLGDEAVVRTPAFSPDGRWMAVATQVSPKDISRRNRAAEDVPQPRIHVVATATGRVGETLIAPQGFAASVCFSPDGRTLATGGDGSVLLWDVTDLAVGAEE
jgi:WD40 repeat protein